MWFSYLLISFIFIGEILLHQLSFSLRSEIQSKLILIESAITSLNAIPPSNTVTYEVFKRSLIQVFNACIANKLELQYKLLMLRPALFYS